MCHIYCRQPSLDYENKIHFMPVTLTALPTFYFCAVPEVIDFNLDFCLLKVKVQLSLCLTKHHARKAYWGVEI
jgi:hypothetical protein